MSSTGIQHALDEIRARIARACLASKRPSEDVRLVAVSKKVPPERLREALDCGQADFGENYLQEALPKIDLLRAPGARGAAPPGREITWHFIGPLQSNKAGDVARHFDWVHGVDRLKVAKLLSQQRPAGFKPLDVCVQVNISGEQSKSGVAPAGVEDLCREITALPNLRLRGLMAIPAPVAPGADPRAPYRALRTLFEMLRSKGFHLDTLSAGMTDDFEAAIAEGSTMVRIGTAIFGKRAQ